MKYQVPGLRVLSELYAYAECSNGSGASGGECATNGSSATDGCVNNGLTANLINCQDGSAADQAGPNACSIGDVPMAFCDTGTSA